MSRLEIVLIAVLFISVIFNIGICVYAKAAISRLLFMSEEMGDLQNMINSFATHLQRVYELDAFYGDETLRHLLDHAISLNEQLENYEEIYTLTENEDLQIYDNNQAETED